MDILVNVSNQKLSISNDFRKLVAGTQKFIRFIFNLNEEWKNLTPFAQFIQNGVAYNDYLDDDNSVYLPSEITPGVCKLILYGSNNGVIGTTNFLNLYIDDNNFISDASSTEISQSLYDQLISRFNEVINGVKGEPFRYEDFTPEQLEELRGYTPVKGVDYWTQDDQDSVRNDNIEFITTELSKRGQLKPEFANSIDECTDTTKLYVLPDGQIYAYMMHENINYSYDNLLTSDKWLPENRVSSSGEIKADGAEGMVAVGDIPCKAGDLVRIKNFDLTINVGGRLAFVNSEGSPILTLYTAQNYDGSNIGFFKDQISETDGIQSFIVGVDGTGTQISSASSITAIRFSQVSTRVGSMEDVIVTVNQEITEPTVVREYIWSDTGHAFVTSAYEDRIVELEESVSGLQRDVYEFRENINNLEAVSVPSYYDDMIANKTDEVKSLQSTCGNNCVSFVWASDTHIPDNSGGQTNDIGKVMAKILNNCQIPFAVISGDVGTQASHTTEDALLESQKNIPEHLAPLWGTDRLLVSLGNHDGAWGDSSGYYRHQLTPQRMFQLYFSGQALDFRRVFSDDGLYFYVDDVSHKARYIVLNSQFAGEYAEDSNGWAVNNRFGTSCYGQSQLEWFANVALDMPSGYGAIVVTHVPLNIDYTVDRAQLIGIINAHCNKTTFHGEITDGVDGWSNSTIDVNYQNATGEIIAVFTGHIHKDTVDTTTLACPMISITTAGGDVRDTDVSARTSGTDSETAFDIVTINRTTKRINCTRVGAGQSREIEYTSYASSQEPNKSEDNIVVQMPKFVNSVDEMTNINDVYVLASTGDIWVYMDTTVTREITDKVEGTDDNPYLNGNRLGSDGSAVNDSSEMVLTPYIDIGSYVDKGKITLKLAGIQYIFPSHKTNVKVALYDENKAKIVCGESCLDGTYGYGGGIGFTIADDNSASVTLSLPYSYSGKVVKYMRFNTIGTSEASDISIIYTGEVIGSQWVNTNLKYSPVLTDDEKTSIAEQAAALIDITLLDLIGDEEVVV